MWIWIFVDSDRLKDSYDVSKETIAKKGKLNHKTIYWRESFRLIPFVLKSGANIYVTEDLENGTTGTKEKAKVGTADFLIELENKRAIKVW